MKYLVDKIDVYFPLVNVRCSNPSKNGWNIDFQMKNVPI